MEKGTLLYFNSGEGQRFPPYDIGTRVETLDDFRVRVITGDVGMFVGWYIDQDKINDVNIMTYRLAVIWVAHASQAVLSAIFIDEEHTNAQWRVV